MRRSFAYGDQDDYFESPSSIGWARHGEEEQSGKTYADYTGNNEGKVNIDDEGFGEFMVAPISISIWVEDEIDLD